MVAICATFFSFGSAGPVWLCVRADGSLSLKANTGAPCKSGCCGGESDDHEENNEENALTAVSVPDNCCLDIPLGLDGKSQVTRPTQVPKTDSFPASAQTEAICTQPIQIVAEFSLLTQSQPPGSSSSSFLIRTVVLLI